MIANDVEQERRKMFRRTDSVTGVFKTFPWEDYQIFLFLLAFNFDLTSIFCHWDFRKLQ